MTSHLGIMILFSAGVAVVFGTLLRDDPAEQVRLGTRVFASLVVGAIVVGWLMHVIAL